MFCGLLIRLGDAPFWPLYITLMLGDLLSDIAWYYVGYYFGGGFIRRFGKYFSVTEESVDTVKKIFHKYDTRILIISKITTGFGFALVTLITAGIVKIPIRKYVILNSFGQVIWTAILVFIGYKFGDLYLSIDGILGKMSAGAMFVIALLALFGWGKYMKQKITTLIK